jgi:hypothetical protein
MNEDRTRPSHAGRPLSIEIERVILRDPAPPGASGERLCGMIEAALQQLLEQRGLPAEFGRDSAAMITVSQAASLGSRDGSTGTSPGRQTANAVAGGLYQALGRVR